MRVRVRWCVCVCQRLLLNKDESKAVEQIRLDLDRTLVDNAIFTSIPDKYAHRTTRHARHAPPHTHE